VRGAQVKLLGRMNNDLVPNWRKDHRRTIRLSPASANYLCIHVFGEAALFESHHSSRLRDFWIQQRVHGYFGIAPAIEPQPTFNSLLRLSRYLTTTPASPSCKSKGTVNITT